MARTVVDSKPEKGFECLYRIIDNVFNNSINYYSVQKEIGCHDLILIGHTFDPVPVKIKEMLVRL